MLFFDKTPLAAVEGRRVRHNRTTTISQRASILQCLDHPIENALVLVKFGEDWGKIEEDIIGF